MSAPTAAPRGFPYTHRTVAQVWATERRSIAAAIRVLVDDRPLQINSERR